MLSFDLNINITFLMWVFFFGSLFVLYRLRFFWTLDLVRLGQVRSRRRCTDPFAPDPELGGRCLWVSFPLFSKQQLAYGPW